PHFVSSTALSAYLFMCGSQQSGFMVFAHHNQRLSFGFQCAPAMRYARLKIQTVSGFKHHTNHLTVQLEFEFHLATQEIDKFIACVLEKDFFIRVLRKREHERIHVSLRFLMRQAHIVVAIIGASAAHWLLFRSMYHRDW